MKVEEKCYMHFYIDSKPYFIVYCRLQLQLQFKTGSNVTIQNRELSFNQRFLEYRILSLSTLER